MLYSINETINGYSICAISDSTCHLFSEVCLTPPNTLNRQLAHVLSADLVHCWQSLEFENTVLCTAQLIALYSSGPAPRGRGPPNRHAWPPQSTSLLFSRQRLLSLISNFSLPDKRLTPLFRPLCRRLWHCQGRSQGGQREQLPLPKYFQLPLAYLSYIIRSSRCRQARAHPGVHRTMDLRPYHLLTIVWSTKLKLF